MSRGPSTRSSSRPDRTAERLRIFGLSASNFSHHTRAFASAQAAWQCEREAHVRQIEGDLGSMAAAVDELFDSDGLHASFTPSQVAQIRDTTNKFLQGVPGDMREDLRLINLQDRLVGILSEFVD